MKLLTCIFDFCILRFNFQIMYIPNQKQNFYDRKDAGAYPKRPLHSFQDLEVYQKTLECSVLVAKRVDEWLCVPAPDVAQPLPTLHAVEAKSPRGRKGNGDVHSMAGNIGTGTAKDLIIKNLLACTLAIPHQVAEAHSLRFGDHTAGIAAIEKAMLNCNKMVVYLEQFRDICESGIEWEFFDGAIKKYLYVRRKMLNLERSWKKFMPGYKEEA